ncbi:MAG: uncharacterized protein JWR26_4684 [Pedosphaera sp.]|nr:uncharacterized protein [Pedosphaera sp.]
MKPDAGRRHHFGLRTVAIFELAKGMIVFFIGLGLLSLIHRDVQDAAEGILKQFHLDPAWHYSRKFIEAASKLNDTRIWRLSFFAMCYSVFRLTEAYGLWYGRPWAEWLAIVSSGMFIPVEVHHLFVQPGWRSACVLIGNLLIVAYLIYILLENHKVRAQAKIAAAGKRE